MKIMIRNSDINNEIILLVYIKYSDKKVFELYQNKN